MSKSLKKEIIEKKKPIAVLCVVFPPLVCLILAVWLIEDLESVDVEKKAIISENKELRRRLDSIREASEV